MELIIGKTAGFCFGVRNAVDKATEKIENANGKIYCLGELVHNEMVMENITKKGVITVNDISEIPSNAEAIIRAHGVSKEVYEFAKSKNIKLIDLTCPKVLKVHDLAELFHKEKQYIMLIAEKSHPETIGTKGFCGHDCSIIEAIDEVDLEVENFKKSNLNKIAIIAQTTFSLKKFEEIVKKIKEKVSCNVEVYNTICNATAMRQVETAELSQQVDLMIINGGKNSANTKRLYEIACKNCKNTILIQNKNDEELKNILKNEFNKIGIMAGASTPQESINDIVNYINEKYGK